MKSTTQPSEKSDSLSSDDADDLVWGAENIGAEINRTKEQVYYLHSIGALDGAVAKLAHKTFLGSRRRLRDLVGLNNKKQS